MYMPPNIAEMLNKSNRFLRVDVLRPANGVDCTNGGLTSIVDELFVPHLSGPLLGSDIHDRLKLTILPTLGIYPPRTRPLCLPTGKHAQFGGNWVYSGDLRFTTTYGNAPVSVHDRVE